MGMGLFYEYYINLNAQCKYPAFLTFNIQGESPEKFQFSFHNSSLILPHIFCAAWWEHRLASVQLNARRGMQQDRSPKIIACRQ